MLPLPLLAKYPFLPGAAEFVGSKGPPVEELLLDRAYARVRARGLARVRGALEDAGIEATPVDTEPEALAELLSYGVGRMIVASLAMPHAARRSATAEAKLAHARLVQEPDEVVREVATLLGLRVREGAVHFTDYLRCSVPLKDPEWKLVNQPLEAGYVRLDKRKLARLCQEAARQRVEAAGGQGAGPEVRKAFEAEVRDLRRLAEEQLARFQGGDLGPARLELLPPCMARLLAQLQAGVNVPHTGRFAVTSFLHTIGMGAEDIMKLFAAAPDFKEEMTRYQVEHITGKTSGTEYTPPGCSTMVTYGLCPMEELPREQRERFCTHPRMKHPLTFYRWKVNDARRGGQVPAAKDPPRGSGEVP